MYPANLVDTPELLNFCLSDVSSPSVLKLAVDLEGIDLSRNGTISLLQILSNESTHVWVIDIFTLGADAFGHIGPHGKSLKDVLEDPRTTKMFWDVRNDSDALFSLYGINLEAVYDIQLLEVAFRRSKNKRSKVLKGLGDAVVEYVKPGATWTEVKETGKCLLFPDKGGSYEFFERRPLDPRILDYAANDVTLLFSLVEVLEGGLGRKTKWSKRILEASSVRVGESQQADYDPNGKKRVLHQFSELITKPPSIIFFLNWTCITNSLSN